MEDYIVIENEALNGFRGLTYDVNKKIKEGYQCIGGITSYVKDNEVFLSYGGNIKKIKPKNIFCQAMILKEDNNF